MLSVDNDQTWGTLDENYGEVELLLRCDWQDRNQEIFIVEWGECDPVPSSSPGCLSGVASCQLWAPLHSTPIQSTLPTLLCTFTFYPPPVHHPAEVEWQQRQLTSIIRFNLIFPPICCMSGQPSLTFITTTLICPIVPTVRYTITYNYIV